MTMHPRFKHFPWQADYSAQPNQFCPYVMATAQPGYASASVNIDALGFRVQYDPQGRRLELSTAREQYESCILLLGNSTSFGVSLSSDDKSLGHYLGEGECPCINLSIRGATMQQELATFLTFKHLLPKVNKIIIVTGICDVSLAIQPEDIYSTSVGGMHSMETFFKKHYDRVVNDAGVPGIAKENYLAYAETIYHRYSWLQKYCESRVEVTQMQSKINQADFERNLSSILNLMENVIQSWGWLQSGSTIETDIVLQPVVGWTSKPQSEIEEECIAQDLKSHPGIGLYANAAVHNRVNELLSRSCASYDLKYLDANSIFDGVSSKHTCFSDICHLTDYGTELLASVIDKGLM